MSPRIERNLANAERAVLDPDSMPGATLRASLRRRPTPAPQPRRSDQTELFR